MKAMTISILPTNVTILITARIDVNVVETTEEQPADEEFTAVGSNVELFISGSGSENRYKFPKFKSFCSLKVTENLK